MDLIPFETERWFGRYEFACQHLIGASDCESTTVGELLALAEMSLDDVRLGYTESAGSAPLRAAIAANYSNATPDDIVVLNAPQEGIFLLMHALLAAGDDVIVLTPAYDSLCNLPLQLGAGVQPWSLRPTPTGWAIDLDELQKLLAEVSPRLLVINIPHNPTGFVPTAAEFAQIFAMAEAVGCAVFCDEMYRGLTLDPAYDLPSAIDASPLAVVLGGLSKAHGLPGLRCGWLVVRDPALREAIVGWKFYTTICPPSPIEALALAALRVADVLLDRNRQRIVDNERLAAQFFGSQPGFVWRAPRAGSVALVETPWADATAICRVLAEQHGVVLLPGGVLGGPRFSADPRFVRVGLGRNGLGEGLAALGDALASR